MNREQGIDLLKARMEVARTRLRETAGASITASPPPPFPWVVTGIGSSESHARFLCSLVQRIAPGAATFAHLSSFAVSTPPAAATLIVFSQGLSANARIALAHRGAYPDTVIFTAKDQPDTPFAPEKNMAFVRCPEADEFTILLRVIGPMVTFLSAWQWLRSCFPECPAPPAPEMIGAILSAVDQVADDTVDELAEDLIAGVEFNFIGETSGYTQNLGFKRVEGLFLPEPPRRDILQAAHGPIQQNHAGSCAQWIFTSESPSEKTLTARLLPMFGRLNSPVRTIAAPVPEPASVFFFEALVNRVLASAIGSSPHSQFDWPGKGMDGEGYQLDGPLPGVCATP